MTMPMQYTGTHVPDVRKFPHTPSKKDINTSTSSSTSSTSTSSTTVQFCQYLEEEEMLRNRCELLRKQYSDCIGEAMTKPVMRQLLLSLIDGTPWEYYEYAIEEAALAPVPSWRYIQAIVRRLVTQAVPVDQIRQPRVKRQSTKTVEQQQYTQREYQHSEDAMDAMMAKWFATEGGEKID